MRTLLVAASGVCAFLAGVLGAVRPASAQSLEIADGTVARVEILTVRATVEEGVALVDLDQTFRNPTGRVLEGVWTIRLPEEAVVHTFSMWMEGREKQGRVLEAKKARAIYDSIVHARRDPALLEEVGHRTFRVSVFPIPANDTVRVRLRYAQVVADDLGVHELAIPMPTGDVAVLDVAADVRCRTGLAVLDGRFGPADAAAIAPTPAAVEPAFAAKAFPGMRVAPTTDGGVVRWSGERTRAAGPFVVRFVPAGEGFSLALLAHRAADDPDGAFLVRIVPRLAAAPDLPRDVVFVVDRSGSMSGSKIAHARTALLHGLGTLRERDRFSVVSFASDVRALAGDELLEVDDASLVRARAEAEALDASGGTNLAGGLEAALRLRPRADGHRLFVVVLLTDGDPTVGVTDPNAILSDWRARAPRDVRLFALGVGPDVKDFLLSRLASGSRGAAQYVRDEATLRPRLAALFEKVRTPVLLDPEITIEGVAATSVEPRPLPDVFRGGAVLLAGRFREGGAATIVLRGRSGTEPVELRFPVVFPKETAARPHVAQLWARARIDRLLEDIRTAGRAVPELRDEIVALGVRHQVVSPYTSFLVVEDGVRIPDERELARVPDAPPSGATAGGPTPPRTGGGHGGQYRGPTGEVPPDSREPSDPPPTVEGGGPGTPDHDAGGPTTGGGDTGGPSTGGGAASPPSGGGGGGGPTKGGGGPSLKSGRSGYDDWGFWWQAESERLLADKLQRAGPPLDAAFVRERLLPTLRALAADAHSNPFVESAAVEALARWRDGDEEARRLLADLQRPGLVVNRAVRERALLSPIWTDDRSDAARDRLLAVLADTACSGFERANAAVALGLTAPQGDARVAEAILTAVNDARDDQVRPACLLALGLMKATSARAPLLAMLRSGRTAVRAEELTDVEVAYAVAALGKIGDPADLDTLVALFDARARTDRNVRRAAVVALGDLAPECDARTRRNVLFPTLRRLTEASEDTQERYYALMAAARMAASPRCEADVRRQCVDLLMHHVGKGKDGAPSYGVLGLALVGRAPSAEPALADRIRRTVRAEFRAATNARYRAACAVVLGVLGARDTADELLAALRDPRAEPRLRGSCALALGMIGGPGMPETIRALLADEDDRELRLHAAAAAGLAGDAGAVDALITVLKGADESQLVLEASARSIARLGDTGAAEKLLAIAVDERRYPDLTRGIAIRALGRMAAGGPDPLVRLCDGFLHRAHVPAIAELHRLATGR